MKIRRSFLAVLVALIFVFGMPLSVLANSPGPIFDEETGKYITDNAFTGFGLVLYIILSVASLIITCLAEYIVAIPFGLTGFYGKLIVGTNILTQLLLHAANLLGSHFFAWDPIVFVVVLEILVYTTEFLVYRWKMNRESWKKCLAYTVTANTASLLLGILLL